MYRIFLLAGLILMLGMSSCGHQNQHLIENAPLISKTYRDDLNREIFLRKTPVKIVSLAPSITEMLFAMGAGDLVAARSQACDYPEAARNKEILTTYPEIDIESMVVMEPDLVLATTEIIPKNLLPLFEKFKIPVYFQKFDSLSGITTNIRKLGALIERPEKAKHLADSLDRILQAITDSTRNKIKYGTMIVVSADPLIVIGGKGYINEMIQKAGGKNVFADLDEAYPTVTPEAILKAGPEYVVFPTRFDQDYAELVDRYPSLVRMPAAGLKQVFVMDPDLIYRPGPRTMEGLAGLANILHSGLHTGDFFDSQNSAESE